MQSSSTPLVAVYRVKRRKTEIKVTVKWALSDTCKSNERLDTRKRNMPDMQLEDEVTNTRRIKSPKLSQSDPIPDPKEGSSTQPQQPSEKRQKGQTRVTGRGAERKSFAQRIEDLEAYKKKHGNVNVKKREDISLYDFCRKMREASNNPGKSSYIMNNDRIASLDALGLEWNPDSKRNEVFIQRIDNLRAYKEKHGHVNVKEREDRNLYAFCHHMRQARNNPEKSTVALTDDRIASLNALGFEWSTNITNIKAFAKRIADLKAYKEKNGHINVKWSDNNSLYYFCNKMRYAHNNPEKSTRALTDDRIASLDALGFNWKMSFEQRIEDLLVYKEKHGHVKVKQKEDKSLYEFCRHVRHARNNPEKSDRALTDDRLASLDALGFEWNRNSSIKSFAEQTDQPPSMKRKQRGQGKLDTATKKKHVRPKCSAKNDKGCAASSDQMKAPATVKDAAALLDALPTIGHSGIAVSAVSPLAVSTTNALASDNMDAIDLTTDVETDSVNKHPTSLAGVLLGEKGKRLVQVKQEMAETHEDLKDVREDLDIANDTVTQQAVFTDAWQNKFEELAKLAEAGKVDGAKISEIRNRSIGTGQDEARGTDMKEESDSGIKVKMVPV